jgi:N12 class adenine-specific DNA methylase
LIEAERYDRQDAIEGLRSALNERYDAFVAKFGYINDQANASLMSDDVKIEFGLEVNYRKAITAARAKVLGVKPEPAYAEKAEILKGRVFYPEKVITSADSVRDAYDISMSEFGRPNFPYIARLTRTSEEEAIKELSDLELIFQDPETKEWVQEDIYLSGNVKLKHQIALANPGFERNAEALRAVFPADVRAEDIFVDMGQTWIPSDVYEDFLKFMGVRNPEVFCSDYMGQVNITNRPSVEANQNNYELSNPDYSVPQLFNLIANKKPVVAYDPVPPDRTEVNKERTKALGPIVKKFRAAFRSWIFADPERTQLLEKLYNDTQNTHTPRKFNGRLLKTVGNSPAIEYRDHQRSAAWRMIQSKATLLDHRVGAGKTFCAITGIMERKRLGLSRKQLVVVPNHLVGQWARDFQVLYPGANVLAATAKDFEKKNRRRLFSRIATGSFDAIICGHSSLGFIPIEPETEREFIMEEVDHLEQAMILADMNGDKRGVRTIANRIAKKKAKAEDLLNKVRDDVASFEEMGIDHLIVDESHEFKNLEYSTVMRNVVGMGTPKGSKRAFDLYAKIGIVNKRDGAVTFATGTPVSNSLVEMYSILRYLNKNGLKERKLDAFDAWAKHFASIDAVVEYTATNKLKERQVMASFNNLDELLQLYREFADVVQGDDLMRIYAEQVRRKNAQFGTSDREEFPVPKVEGGQRQLNIADANELQAEYMEYLVARAQQLEDDTDFDPSRDNHLWIMSDARKMALDIRLVDPRAKAHADCKVERAASEIRRIYDTWRDDRGTQLVFCDLSTPLKNSEKEAAKFIKVALATAGLDKNQAVARVLESLTWEEKWDYIKGKINKEIAVLADEEGDRAMARQEKLSNFLAGITSEDTASLLTADTGFSVYDGLKESLIDRGIPANEIRFIHEANTPTQKEELFDQVRAGKVRVLVGSTKKMGAGTNVQDRVVALHHLDAPWRPSDVEQREGRVIRQGNLLYARDPDNFRVEIQAYSTANTFDAVMWQILSRKAGMLEQFRKGTRNVLNVEGDSASYAEFMAESTGNPIFREKFRLENEIEELESVERNTRAQRSSAERTMSTAGAAMKSIVKEIREWTETIESMDKVDHVVFEGKAYKLDIEEGRAQVAAAHEAAEAKWEARKIQYTEDIEKWQQDIDAGIYSTDGKLNKKAAQEAKPAKPVGAPLKPTLRDVAEVSEFARLMMDISLRFKAAGGGHVGSVYVGGSTVDFYKTFIHDKSYMTVEIDDHELFDRSARPEDMVLKFADPEVLKMRAEKLLEEARKFLRVKSRNIRGARVTIQNLVFDKADELSEKRVRLDFISEEINRIEEELAETRNPQNNRYIQADDKRFVSCAGNDRPEQTPETPMFAV